MNAVGSRSKKKKRNTLRKGTMPKNGREISGFHENKNLETKVSLKWEKTAFKEYPPLATLTILKGGTTFSSPPFFFPLIKKKENL